MIVKMRGDLEPKPGASLYHLFDTVGVTTMARSLKCRVCFTYV